MRAPRCSSACAGPRTPKTRARASTAGGATAPTSRCAALFIVGFPGETEADFELLLQWLDEAQLDRVGCFKYSHVEGAAANALDGAVPEEIKEERYARFMERAAAISAARLAQRVGKRMRVLIDRVADGIAIARTPGDAPEIDGVVRIRASAATRPGEFIEVEITGADTYDLEARAGA
jgi:ribosomal protein S12 methylthiotransferase